MGTTSAREHAEAILAARQSGRLLDPLSDTAPLTMRQGYEIQAHVLADRLRRGERQVGWKLGYTSQAMREQMGVSRPNLGPLTDRMVLADGTAVGEDVMQPRVEPEVAVIVDQPVGPGADRDEARAAVREARAALEVVDSVWRDYRFRVEDNTADGSSAAYVVLGPGLGIDDLAAVDVALTVDGAEVATGTGAAAMGHPLDALCWLATELAEQGTSLASGDLVITGGLTAAWPLREGGQVSAVFGGDTRVSTWRRPR